MEVKRTEALTLELDLDHEPIRGRVIRTATDEAETFEGWIELASLLERLRTVARPAPIRRRGEVA